MRLGLGIGIDTSKSSIPLFAGVLDSYSAAMAYSLRKLKATATSCVRVRRSSDNAEIDVGFVYSGTYGGYWIDTATLLSHCGAGSGYVTIVYDQSGSSRDATQTTAGAQPRIVNAGVLVTTAAGYPAMEQVNSACLLNPADPTVLNSASGVGIYTLYQMVTTAGSASSCRLFRNYQGSNVVRCEIIDNGTTINKQTETFGRQASGVNRTTRGTVADIWNYKQRSFLHNFVSGSGQSAQCWESGILISQLATYTANGLMAATSSLANELLNAGSMNAKLGEFILFNTDAHRANRATIETDQMTAWGV